MSFILCFLVIYFCCAFVCEYLGRNLAFFLDGWNIFVEDMMWGPGEKIEFFQYILLEHWVGSDLSLLISGGGRDDYNGGVFAGEMRLQSWLLRLAAATLPF